VASGYIHDLARYCIAPPRYLWGQLRAIYTGRTFVCCTVDLCTSPPIPVYGTPRLIGTGNGEKIKRCSPSLNYTTSKGIPASSKAFLARCITSGVAGNPTTAADVGATRIACTVPPYLPPSASSDEMVVKVYPLGHETLARLNPEPRPELPGLFQFLVGLEGLLGPLQIGLLLLAIRRQVMR
jgi:hypothetical protein